MLVSVQDATPAPASTSPRIETTACDGCGSPIDGEPAGRGLYVWTRGDEVRFEEPPLCEACALAICAAVLADDELEDEEG